MSNTTTVSFSAAVYSIEAIKKAAYRLSDRMTADITPRADVIECILHSVSKEIVAPTDLAHAFRAEVLDQDLRASIAAETAAFRNAILAHAFSKTGLQDSE